MPGASARATYELRSDTDAAEKVASSTNTSEGATTTWDEDGECPDDVRAAVYDALKAAFGGGLEVWELLPREVQHGSEYVRVTLVPLTEVYQAEQEVEVDDGPRKRLLATLREYHEELGADQVEREALLEETEGDEATLLEELERLEQQGEVYQPAPDTFRITSAQVEG